MKKTTQLFLSLLFVTASLFTSCETSSTDDQDNTILPASNSAVLLRRAVVTDQFGAVITVDFTYDGNKLISQSGTDGYKDIYSYSNDKLVLVKTYYNEALEWTSVLSYDSNGNLSEEHNQPEGYQDHYIYYETSADGTITETFSDTSHKFENTYLNGNLTEVNHVTGDSDYAYTYDTNSSPFKNIVNKKVVNLFVDDVYENNVLTKTNQTSTASHYENKEVTYTYNSLGYPLTSHTVEKASFNGTIEETVYDIEYFYN